MFEVDKQDKQDKEVDKTPSKTPNSSRGLVGTLGLIAAAASVSTGLSSRLQAQSEADYKKADTLHTSITTARKDLVKDKLSETEALQILDDLEAIRRRNEWY